MAAHQLDIERYREVLLARLAELDRLEGIGRENARPVALDQTSVGRLSRMDAMQLQAMAQETERRRRTERLRIQSALRRIETVDYGYCVRCDEPIAEKRLMLDPATTTCIHCAGAGSDKD
ncbi:MAG: TraR/DksA C4-type zinc finger protein [Thalassobaculales bacterium]